MRKAVVELLCCPFCRQPLKLFKGIENTSSLPKEVLICGDCQKIYKINNGVPDFLEWEEG
ncbi:MAG: Trm112 family protein [Candidatus Hermodarchaeota archaeon]